MSDILEQELSDEVAVEEVIEAETESSKQEALEEVEEVEIKTEDEPELEEGEEDEVSYISTEIDGVEYELPEVIASSVMKNKDYTTKTQAVAARQKELDAREESLKVQAVRDEEDRKIDAQLYDVESKLEQYKNVNWQQLEYDDPDNAQRHFRDYTLLKDDKARLSSESSQRMQERSEKSQQEIAKRYQETDNYITQNIPNWKEVAPNIEAYVRNELKMDMDSVMQSINPQMAQMMYDAYIGSQKSKRVAKPTAKKVSLKPLKTVSTKSGSTNQKEPAKMSMREYEQWRKGK